MDQAWVVHDSHDLHYRRPFGAVPCHETVTLRIAVRAPAPPDRVILSCWRNGCEEQVTMVPESEHGREKVYAVNITAAVAPGLVWYYFIICLQGVTYYYGNNAQRLGGAGQLWEQEPPAYQITVFRPNASTLQWYKEGLVYQIFVDRFYNGHDDKRIENPPKGSLLHPYWDDIPFYVRDIRDGRIFAFDFFGGNLLGVLKKLPYLQQLGVSAIYLNPVFESPSNHKYDTGDYKKIDPMFGDNRLFALLCAKAREMNIAVILDGVFSHTGSDSRYFNKEGRYPDVGAYQSPESPYYKWYRFQEYPDRYESWWGIDTLPNVNELEPSYLKFMLDDEDSVVKWWMKAGIKGWRLDVADELPDSFIKQLRSVMKEQDPDAVLIGEVWEDASRKVSYGTERAYLLGDELDSVTNYPFRSILLDFMLGHNDAAQTQHRLMSLCENYPRENFYAALNVLGTHDVPRILTILGEAPPQKSLSVIEQAKYRLPAVQRRLAVKRLKLLSLWQMTFPGVPCIYYGDEAGVEGYDDPFNRGTYPWGREDRELLDWYHKMTGLRRQFAVLRRGDWRPLPVQGDVYGYLRVIEHGRGAFGQVAPNNTAVILLNRSTDSVRAVSLDLSGYCRDNLIDILQENQVVEIPEGRLDINLEPLEGKLLLWRTEESPAWERGSGILLHPTSLPSPYGIGDLGPQAYAFVDFLARGRQKLWQILPLNPPGYGDSPYQSLSAFAGNHLLISPDLLVEQGLLAPEDVAHPPSFDEHKVLFAPVRIYKEQLLRKAFRKFSPGREDNAAYQLFVEENRLWLAEYALFMALKTYFAERAWHTWPEAVAARDAQVLDGLVPSLTEEIAYQYFLQFIFYAQWKRLKQYANGKGIKIIGDMPIFVSHDSSDVWANQHLFRLDARRRPQTVAGVPPDYFSATGQLWGNPHYDWGAMAGDDYFWWRERFRLLLKLTDIVRIDHFRGFEAYWAVPADEETAVHGTWLAGPGYHFFACMQKYLGCLPVIAEDLGVITRPVEQLRDKFNFPGMTVLQFAFEAEAAMAGAAIGFQENSVVYTGTHDNNTTRGWLEECQRAKPAVFAHVRNRLKMRRGATACWPVVEFALGTCANTVIIPLQDLLCLGSEARMNRPGTVGGNWAWRCSAKNISPRLAARLAGLTEKYGR